MARGETITMTQQVRYAQYMKLRLEELRLNDELKKWDLLSKQLTNQRGGSTYATHKESALVYDTSVIKDRVKQLKKRVGEINDTLTEG